MALCIGVENNIPSLVAGFAKNDLVLKAMSAIEFKRSESNGAKIESSPIDIGDDYFTAPFAFVPVRTRKTKYNREPAVLYVVVFTSYKIRSLHDDAVAFIRDKCPGIAVLGSISEICNGRLAGTKVPETKWLKFRRFAYSEGKDVCAKLEQHAFATAARGMGIKAEDVPCYENWQKMRTDKVAEICALVGDDVLSTAPLATIPEWAEEVSFPMTAVEQAARTAFLEHKRAQIEERQREHAAKMKHEADKERCKRYAATMGECRSAACREDGLCAFVFATDHNGAEKPTACPYDVVTGEAFCSMCCKVIAEFDGLYAEMLEDERRNTELKV